MKTYVTLLGVASLFILVGCSRVVIDHFSKNDTWRLDAFAHGDAQATAFAESVKRFYNALEQKDWPLSYDMRASDFKHDVTRNMYLKQMADSGESLTSYKVLNVRMYGDKSGGDTAAEIIMEFNEAGRSSYSCARWIRRGGKWECEDPGLRGLLTSTRIPDWVTQ